MPPVPTETMPSPAPPAIPPAAMPLARGFLALAFLTWVLIAFGALVRAKQAGLACPDWPLCHGDVLPDLKLKGVVYEFGHRALAGLVSILYVVGAWQVWRQPELKSHLGRQVLAGGVLLLTQVVFGGLTVLIVHRGEGAPRPEAWTVVTHLVLGNSFGALALLTGLQLRQLALPSLAAATSHSRGRALANAWTLALLVQFVLGGAVAANIAGLVCTTFPECFEGVWFPSFTGYVGLQVWHRLTAYTLLVLAVALAWRLRGNGAAGRVAAGLLALVVLQAVLGAVNVYSYLHTAVTTAHSAVAALLFSGTAVLGWLLRRR